jgi:hypothetical protein
MEVLYDDGSITATGILDNTLYGEGVIGYSNDRLEVELSSNSYDGITGYSTYDLSDLIPIFKKKSVIVDTTADVMGNFYEIGFEVAGTLSKTRIAFNNEKGLDAIVTYDTQGI